MEETNRNSSWYPYVFICSLDFQCSISYYFSCQKIIIVRVGNKTMGRIQDIEKALYFCTVLWTQDPPPPTAPEGQMMSLSCVRGRSASSPLREKHVRGPGAGEAESTVAIGVPTEPGPQMQLSVFGQYSEPTRSNVIDRGSLRSQNRTNFSINPR